MGQTNGRAEMYDQNHTANVQVGAVKSRLRSKISQMDGPGDEMDVDKGKQLYKAPLPLRGRSLTVEQR